MKSIYISLITITLFEVLTPAYSQLFEQPEAAQKSRYASYVVGPERVVRTDERSSVTSPQAAAKSASSTPISNGNWRKDETTEAVDPRAGKADEGGAAAASAAAEDDKLKSDVRNAMAETRARLKSAAKRATKTMSVMAAHSSDALGQHLQLESEKSEADAAAKIWSLREAGRVDGEEIRGAMRELQRQTYDRVRAMYFDFAETVRSSRAPFVHLERDFQAYAERATQNAKRHSRLRMEKIRERYNQMVEELGPRVQLEHSRVFDLYASKKRDILRQIEDISNETTETARQTETAIRDTLAERRRDLGEAYAKAAAAAAAVTDPASFGEYANRQMSDVTAEMKNVKKEMEGEMINEIKRIISTLRTEITSIASGEAASVGDAPTTSDQSAPL